MTQPEVAPRDTRFLRACRRQAVDRTPLWFMRQAGRYMAEYRAIRAKHTLLEICAQPELAAQVTLQPIRAFDVDAAILFADILLPIVPMGLHLEFAAGEGPVIRNPVKTEADLARLRDIEPRESLASVLEAIRLVRRDLPEHVAMIGFAGAPFTLASYVIEGGSAREAVHTKQLMYSNPRMWHALMDKLSSIVADYLVAQVEAGAEAVQLFDSWVGALSPSDYEEFVLPHSKRILDAASATGAATIHFGTGTTTLLPLMKRAGGDVIGLDWRIPLDDGWEIVGSDRAVQGNLDPIALFAPHDQLDKRVHDIMKRAGGRPGHIFNLGHGILPGTPVESVARVVDLVHSYRG